MSSSQVQKEHCSIERTNCLCKSTKTFHCRCSLLLLHENGHDSMHTNRKQQKRQVCPLLHHFVSQHFASFKSLALSKGTLLSLSLSVWTSTPRTRLGQLEIIDTAVELKPWTFLRMNFYVHGWRFFVDLCEGLAHWREFPISIAHRPNGCSAGLSAEIYSEHEASRCHFPSCCQGETCISLSFSKQRQE